MADVVGAGGWPPIGGGIASLPPTFPEGRGWSRMVTFEVLLEYSLVILSVINLVIQILKKK